MFKVGDWVRDRFDGEVFKITSEEMGKDDRNINCCELWQPKEGEWCWFGYTNQWHPNDDYCFGKLLKINDNGTFDCDLIHSEVDGLEMDFCEPFIGELPSFIKD